MRRLSIVAILVCLPLLLGVSTCEPTTRRDFSTLKFTTSESIKFDAGRKQPAVVNQPGKRLSTTFDPFFTVGDRLTDVCTDENKVVCEWDADPNNLRVFESTNGVNGHAWNGSRTAIENRARCVQPRTAAGICEDHLALVGGGAQSWNVSAVSVHNIGLCSSSMPANEFAALLTEEWRKGTEDRLGGQTPPNAGDVFLWSDVTIDLKTGDFPPEMFFDWTVPIFLPGQRDASMEAESVLRTGWRVDGDLDFSFDRDWHVREWPEGTYGDQLFGNDNQGTTERVSVMLQALVRFNPITFWLPLVLGNCEKDRPAVVQLRGSFEGTDSDPSDRESGGVGLRVNSKNNCGPNGNWPCSWSSVLDWPARPWCNNHMVGRIQDFLLASSYAQFGEQPPSVTDPNGNRPEIEDCFTCTEAGSILPPFHDRLGNRLPIRDVVLTPTRVHFVHVTEIPPNPDDFPSSHWSPGLEGAFERLAAQIVWDRYSYLKSNGHCGLDRAIPAETAYLRKQGEHL